MSYVLGLSFQYHRYRNDAVMKIYADDRLVDELHLDQDIIFRPVFKSKRSATCDLIGPRNSCDVEFIPEKLFLFELDEEHLNNEIRIAVENDNNNYTNGFMTEFSYINFFNIFLIPDSLMFVQNWRKIERIHTPEKKLNNTDNFPTWFSEGNHIVVKNNMNINKNIQDDEIQNQYFCNIGGNFTITLPLNTKHRIRHIGRPIKGKVCINRVPALLLSAFGALNTIT